MLTLPDSVYLDRIKPRETFCDEKSVEVLPSGEVLQKRKYKVSLDYQIYDLGSYPFYVLTSKPHYSVRSRVELSEADFQNIDSPYLQEWPSYACPFHCEVISKSDLLEKFKDGDNKFLFVATLNEEKYEKIKANANQVLSASKSMEKKLKILSIVHGPTVAEEILKNLLS